MIPGTGAQFSIIDNFCVEMNDVLVFEAHISVDMVNNPANDIFDVKLFRDNTDLVAKARQRVIGK